MPVNGLLLTLNEDESLVSEALLELGRRGDIELGERTDRWQPVVVETTGGAKESHEIHEWLEDLPGVEKVDVVFTSVDEPDSGQSKQTLQ